MHLKATGSHHRRIGMFKRSYLGISLFTTLGIVITLALGSATLADDQKDKDKAEKSDKQKSDSEKVEKQKEKELETASERVFELSNVVGSESYLGVYLEEVTDD